MAERADGAADKIASEFSKLAESITSDIFGLAAPIKGDVSSRRAILAQRGGWER